MFFVDVQYPRTPYVELLTGNLVSYIKVNVAELLATFIIIVILVRIIVEQ